MARQRRNQVCKAAMTFRLTDTERSRLYRAACKANPEVYSKYLEKERMRSKKRRLALTDEKKALLREQCKFRMQCFRKRQRAATAQTPSVMKPMTRKMGKEAEERKRRNREAQRKRRSNMSAQKKRREREKSLKYYYQKKSDKLKAKGALRNVQEILDQTPKKLHSFPSLSARSSAVNRFQKKMMATGCVGALSATVRSLFKKIPDRLHKLGINYCSPRKMKPMAYKASNTKASTILRSFSFNTANELSRALDFLKHKRDKDTLKCTRIICDAAKKITAKYNNLYKRKQQNSRTANAKAFLEKTAVYLPGLRYYSKRGMTQKKILQQSLQDVYAQYRKENDKVNCSFSAFCKQLPKYVLSYTKTPLIQCVCELCYNPEVKMKALNRLLAQEDVVHIERGVDGLIAVTLCPTKEKFHDLICINRKCGKCGVNLLHSKLHKLLTQKGNEIICWEQWGKENVGQASRMKKIKKSTTVRECVEVLCTEIQTLSKHRFTARWQSAQYQDITRNVPKGWAIITLDFAENFRCDHQDQPQSGYYGYSQVTLHPVIMHYKCHDCNTTVVESAVFLSNILDHSAHFVNHITNIVLQHLHSVEQFRKFVIFSDGCGSQYKSKLPFHYLTQINDETPVERCFFGARHGKNLCDALGGTVKSAAKRAVKARQVVISDASSLLDFCQAKLQETAELKSTCNYKRRWFALIKEEDVQHDAPADLKPLPGTRTFHSIVPVNKDILAVRELSCFCDACRNFDYNNCRALSHVKAWQRVQLGVHKSRTRKCQRQKVHKNDYFTALSHKMHKCSTFQDLQQLALETETIINRDYPLCVQQLTSDNIHNTEFEVDFDATQLYPLDAPNGLVPVKVVADGNCFPRALSLLVYGSQDCHIEMRCRIVVELTIHIEQYLAPDNWGFSQQQLHILASLSDNFVSNIQSTFEQETMTVRVNASYMGLWQVLAAANVLGCTVKSIYPNLGWAQLRNIHHREIRPLSTIQGNKPTLHIMWSSTRVMDDRNWVANHFVPLIPVPGRADMAIADIISNHFVFVLNDSTTVEPDTNFNLGLLGDPDLPQTLHFYVVTWQGTEFIAQVVDVDTDGQMVQLDFMQRKGDLYSWPPQKDIGWEPFSVIVRPVKEMILKEDCSTNRMQFFVPKF